MALINFQKQFASSVEMGEKRQTIRKPRKNKIKPGDTLYLYTGLRTKNTKKLKEVKCKSVENIKIYEDCYVLDNRWKVSPIDGLARADGFKDGDDMIEWFKKTHGLPFKGWLIKW